MDELHCGSEAFGVSDGQRVDDPGALEPWQMVNDPGEPFDRREGIHDGQLQTATGQRTTQDQGRLAELSSHVQRHAGVGGRRRRENRSLGVERPQDVGNAPVVRAEVVPPVGDGMCFVDDQQPEPAGELVEDAAPKSRVGQPLGRDQKDVELIRSQGSLDPRPCVDVRGVQCRRPKPGPCRRCNLVAHQGEQR